MLKKRRGTQLKIRWMMIELLKIHLGLLEDALINEIISVGE